MKRNPFRSEADAFRLFLLVGGAVVVVIGVALVLGSRVGAIFGALLLLYGLFHMARWIMEAISEPEKVGRGGDDDAEADAED